MELRIDSSRGIYRHELTIDPDHAVILSARDLRRDRTGLHGTMAILLNEIAAAHDVGNLGRDEFRAHLLKSAFASKVMGNGFSDLWGLAEAKWLLDEFAVELQVQFAGRYVGQEYGAERIQGGSRFALRPYILEGGGTILFSPPGSGKTWLAELMAQSINRGISKFWPVQRAQVCFVNLERDQAEFLDRLAYVNELLGVSSNTGIVSIHQRGRSLAEVYESVLSTIVETGASVLFLDSLSRAGLGSLKEDETANAGADMLNALARTWFAVGHTGRKDESHLYGNIMFDAAADIIVQLSSEERENSLGMALRVTKANRVRKPPLRYYAFDFKPPEGEDDFSSIPIAFREAKEGEFSELVAKRKYNLDEQIIAYLNEVGSADAGEIAEAIKRQRQHVSSFLSSNPDRIVKLPKLGKRQPYGLKSERV